MSEEAGSESAFVAFKGRTTVGWQTEKQERETAGNNMQQRCSQLTPFSSGHSKTICHYQIIVTRIIYDGDEVSHHF